MPNGTIGRTNGFFTICLSIELCSLSFVMLVDFEILYT